MTKLASKVARKTEPAAKKASAKSGNRTAAKKAPPATGAKVLVKVVSTTLSGGYQVFGSPIRPKHVTPQAILEAVAAVD